LLACSSTTSGTIPLGRSHTCTRRSQRTLERILTALGELLSEKSFDQISMVELAERAGCAVTSIYARFKDKWSMIAALHESFRDDAMVRIDAFLAPERWRSASADAIIADAMATLVSAYDKQRHLMRAVLLTEDPQVYARAILLEQHIAERLVEVLPAPAGAAAEARQARVRFGVRVVLATLEQNVLFTTGAEKQTARTNAELTTELTNLMTAYLGYSQGKGSQRNYRQRPPKETSR
jgi:AcrR family transcriptional regulator